MTEAREIAERVFETAYMNYAYSANAYQRVAEFLIDEMAFTPAQAEWVMQSKHMRWADDRFGSGELGRAKSGNFRRYFDMYQADIRGDLLRYSDDIATYEREAS